MKITIALLLLSSIVITETSKAEAITNNVVSFRQSFEDELLNEIVVYIKEHLNTPLTVENICQNYSVSRSTLQSLFKKNLEVAPKQYINECKLSKSKLLIKENKYTLSEVSDILSYTSIHYFSRTFKKRFGITPSEYAKSIYK